MKGMKFKTVIFFLVLFGATSCIKEDFAGTVSDASLKFRISVPANTFASEWTRSGGSRAYDVENLSVFVVDVNGQYRGRYTPSILFAENENRTQWLAEVPLPEVDGNVTLHFIANYNDNLPADIDSPSTIGKLITELIPSFTDQRPDPNAEDYGSFVMWGLVHLDKLTSLGEGEPISVSLIRNVSTMSIEFDQKIINDRIFEFEQLTLYNVRKAGTVGPFPFPADMEDATLRAMTKATEPSTGEIGNYEGKPGQTTLYCYPRQNRTWNPPLDRDDCTFLILKGKYKNSKTPDAYCYYRIELTSKEVDPTTGATKFQAYEIKRNVNYVVHVNEISGPGYNTVEEAIKYPSSNNINTVLSDVPSTDIIDVISNGQYKLGFSRSTVVLYGEPVVDDKDWFEVCKVYADELIEPDSLTVGDLPSLPDDLVCTLRNNTEGLLLFDGMTSGTDGRIYLKTEYHHNDDNPYVSILAKRSRCIGPKRTAEIDVQFGNLQNVITITQSENYDFDIPEVVYVGWKSLLDTNIPIRVENTAPAFTNLVCTLKIENESLGFLRYKNNQQTVILANQFSEGEIAVQTKSSYYAKTKDDGFYRTQKVIIEAEGFNPATVTVKQSKFLDGIYGTSLVGIMRGDNETDVYTTSFGNSEERWSAKVVQGEDFIRLGTAGSGSAELTEIGSNTSGNIDFDYRLLQNTTGKERFGRIEITYAKEQWVHNIYVCQGINDVSVTYNGVTTQWASGNTVYYENDKALHISRSTSYPGAMFKFGDLTYTPYNPIEPSWGVNYAPYDILYTAAWGDATGNRGNWALWNPCPEGYQLPSAEQFKVWDVNIAGEDAGGNIVTGKPYQKVVWGRVSNSSTTMLRPGMLYVFLDEAGDVTKLFFLPAGGVRSETFRASTGNIKGNGKLLYGHYKGNPDDPENDFGNQGGAYWFRHDPSVSGGVLCVDLYHDPKNNIGLDVLNRGGASWLGVSVGDAMPVRCVRVQ